MTSLFALFLPDRNHRLRWRNVVSWTIFNFIIRRLKTFSKVLLRVRQSVSVTHRLIVADSCFVMAAPSRHKIRLPMTPINANACLA